MEIQNLYFAINKKDGKLFNPFTLNKMAWYKLGHLKGIFKRLNINKEDFNVFEIQIINGNHY